MIETATGTRRVSDLELMESATSDQRTIEPGDIIVAKTMSNPLSRLIGKMDGWWCHTAIAVDAEHVAHSNSRGVSIMTIAELKSHYEAGIGVARPGFDQQTRQRAADWAEAQAGLGGGYSARDLGTAFSVLWRAANQPDVLELFDEVFKNESTQDVSAWRSAPESTCSGFAYLSYSDGAESPLAIDPAPGVRLDGDLLTVPSRYELLDEAEREVDGLVQPEGLMSELRITGIAVVAAIEALRVIIMDGPVSVSVGVTPADMWMSPSHSDRWFLDGAEEATTAVREYLEAGGNERF